MRQEGPVTYLLEVSDGRLWKRHIDHVKECHFTPDSPTTASDSDINVDVPSAPNLTDTGAYLPTYFSVCAGQPSEFCRIYIKFAGQN